MQISKNKKYQFLFFFILSIYIIFNGGNSNLAIQFNFILVGSFYLFCLNDKNYHTHQKNFYNINKHSIIIYLLFLLFLIFQIIPLPEYSLKIFSPEKYRLINLIGNISNSSISLSPSDSFFQILNFISLLLIVLICKMIFYNERHKYRIFIYFSFVGFVSSILAVILYLYGNPDILIYKNSYYKNASTGFFINRTVFSIFLLFCLISCFELLKHYEINPKSKRRDYFFLKIYIRLFVIFITIGIITSFSRIGNFLLLVTILFYFLNEVLFSKEKNNSFILIILLIIFFDLLILGIYFGSSQIVDRFYFLKEDIYGISTGIDSMSRFDIAKFGLKEFKNFIFFGYGMGSFEYIFQLKFINQSNLFANHAHSDIIEFFGELGLVGVFLLFLSTIKFFVLKKNYNLVNYLIFTYLITILLFDFSIHIPLIQILFIIFFIINKKSYGSS